jgi:DNA-binding transcriptional ArsR family regulator
MSDEHHESGPALAAVDVGSYGQASELLRALTAPIRLALVDILADGPRCVHELVDALGVPQPLVSQHLKVLRAADLVATSRRGREMVYRLVDEHVSHVVRDTVAHAAESPPQPNGR